MLDRQSFESFDDLRDSVVYQSVRQLDLGFRVFNDDVVVAAQWLIDAPRRSLHASSRIGARRLPVIRLRRSPMVFRILVFSYSRRKTRFGILVRLFDGFSGDVGFCLRGDHQSYPTSIANLDKRPT